MNILNLKCGSKFILIKDFVDLSRNIYPKDLIISLVKLSINRQGKEIKFRILASKKILNHYYKNMDQSILKKYRKWSKGAISFSLSNENLDKFLSEENIRSFDKEYKELGSLDFNLNIIKITDKKSSLFEEILIQVDDSCEMAAVILNNKCIMEGNFWDFHPGCHGIYEYGNFKTFTELAFVIKNKLESQGKKVLISREPYEYKD